MTDQQLPATPTHQQLAAETRSKPKRVTGKLAEAVERMLELGEPWEEAARNVGLTSRAMRLALSKPHVIAHLKREKQIVREHLSAANIFRLTKIRDAGDNMPAVQAIKLLEQMDDTTNNRAGSGTSQVPGFTIVLNVQGNITGSVTEQQRGTDAKPLILHAADTLTESVKP